MNIKDWIESHFFVVRYSGEEALLICPKCRKPKFYFNLNKKLGWCHRDSCHYAPNLLQLKELVGSSEYIENDISLKKEEPTHIVLPGIPIFPYKDLQIDMERFKIPVEYLHRRGIKDQDIKKFQMTFDGMRIYVPVYYNSELVSYVGRDIFGMTKMRYKYLKGSKIAHHFLGWDESKLWNKLTLVENTFVSIWLRNYLNCTTNFGSHLSDEQIAKIKKMKYLNTVAILWDQGAEQKAENACYRLAANGIKAAYAKIVGQPDDYSLEEITEIGVKTHECAASGRICYDYVHELQK